MLSLRTASISGREPKPLFKLLQAEVSRDIAILPLCCGTILLPWEKKSPPKQKKQTQLMKFGHEQQKSLEIVGAQLLGLNGQKKSILKQSCLHWDLLGKLRYNRSGFLSHLPLRK